MLQIIKKYNNQASQSAALKGFTGLLLFFSISFLVRFLGESAYGVWVLVFGFFQWGLYFDFGISNVLKSKIPELTSKKLTQASNIYINESIKITFLISLMMFLVFFCVIYAMDLKSFFKLEFSTEFTRKLFIVNALFFCINFVLTINKSLFTGVLKPVFSEISSTITQLVFLISIIVSFILFQSQTTEDKLFLITYINGFTSIIISLLFFVYFFLKHPYKLTFEFKFNSKVAADIFKNGFQFMMIQSFMVVIFFSDTYLIARFLDLKLISVFDVLNRLYQLPLLVIIAGISSLWPFFSKKFHDRDFHWFHKAFKRFDSFYILIIMAVLVFTLISPFIMNLWVGQELAVLVDFKLIILMSLIVLARIYFTFYANFFNGINQLKSQIIVIGVTAVLKLPVTIYALKQGYGLEGILVILLLFMLIWAVLFKLKSSKIINQLVNE